MISEHQSYSLTQYDFWLGAGCFTVVCLGFGAYLRVVWKCDWRTFYIGSSRVKLILACQQVLKWVHPATNQKVDLHSHSSNTTSENARHTWKETIEFVCRTTNGKVKGHQLPTKVSLSWGITLMEVYNMYGLHVWDEHAFSHKYIESQWYLRVLFYRFQRSCSRGDKP